MNTTRRSLGPITLFVALIVTAAAYYPAVGGSLHFDDSVNLQGLAQVDDTESAFRFIMEGIGGPLGRPLALASFVPQAYAWSDAPAVFLHVNICLHLLNGVLVVWALYLLSKIWLGDQRQAEWISAMSGAIWMLTPLLASSSLLVVQRMTTLSATFLLLGLIGYLYSRMLLHKRSPGLAITLMSISVVLGSTLAVLSKENGALLPLLVLVIESTILSTANSADRHWWWKTWFTAFLVLPAVALLAYLSLQLDYSEGTILRRGFSGTDRLLTEVHILWEYLYHALLPRTSSLGPFHDDHFVARNWTNPLSLLALAGWLAVTVLAVVYRRRAPLLSFAVGWYLLGHALESTTLPLELYFEHRNYVPLIGPAFALVAAASTTRWKISPSIVRLGLSAYALSLAVVLFNTAALWGQPALAAEIWAIHHPMSSRANQYLAQRIEETGDLVAVRKVLRSYLETDRANAGVALQILALSCALEPKDPHQELIELINSSLATPQYRNGSFSALQLLYRVAKKNQCDAVNGELVYKFATVAAANPAFQAAPVEHHNLHVLMAEEAFEQRNLDLTMRHIESALDSHYSLSTLSLAVMMLNSAGLHSASMNFLEEAENRKPFHPVQASIWTRELEALKAETSVAAATEASGAARIPR